jgi:PHP domain
MDADIPTKTPDLALTGRFAPDEERAYRHVPFEVPDGIRQLHLRVDYNLRIGSSPMLRGGNTLDIGLFDQRGAHSGSPGFRGWSGSEKTTITIDQDWATPPYRPGPLEGGTWQVLLGPYKVAPEGLEYRLEIWFDPGLSRAPEHPPGPQPAPRRPVVLAPEPGWVRGDLHSHSLYSDGDSSREELLARAASIGLDFLGITDHNAASPPVAPGADQHLPLLIPGTEVTTYGGHWNVWGANRWFDFRAPDREAVMREMQIARESAGLVSVNHPRPYGPEWLYGTGLGYHAIEVWNGPWLYFNAISLAFWEEELQLGRRIVAVGGSDTHYLKGEATGFLPRAKLGEPTMWVEVGSQMTVESILSGLRGGRSFMSVSPEGPILLFRGDEQNGVQVRVRRGQGNTLMLIAGGRTLESQAIDRDVWSMTAAFPLDARYVRAQIVDEALNMKAISNPIWREHQTNRSPSAVS